MEMKVRHKDEIVIIDLNCIEIDHKNTNILIEKLSSLIEEEVKYIGLNFEGVSWLTSSGIGSILNIRKMLNKLEGEICLYNLTEQVLGSIRVLMIDRILPVFNNEEKALEYLKSSPISKVEKICTIEKISEILYNIEIKERQLDLQNAGDVESKAISLIEEDGAKFILIDFFNVNLITSSGIGALLSIYNSSINKNAELIIYNINEDIKESLEISMVDKILNIANDKEAALLIVNQQ